MFICRRIFCILVFLFVSEAFPQQGIWDFDLNQDNDVAIVTKTVFVNSRVYIRVNCDNHLASEKAVNISVSFVIWAIPCFEETAGTDGPEIMEKARQLHESPDTFKMNLPAETAKISKLISPKQLAVCGKHNTITLEPVPFTKFAALNLPTIIVTAQPKAEGSKSVVNKAEEESSKAVVNPADIQATTEQKTSPDKVLTGSKVKRDAMKSSDAGVADTPKVDGVKTTTGKLMLTTTSQGSATTNLPVEVAKHVTDEDAQVVLAAEGVYWISVRISSANEKFNASVEIRIAGDHGYLSAVDWPLLPFYGVLCGLYVIFGVVWLVVSACQWRDLLRIQFWIGGVIVLGMLEKAVLYAEYQSINSTGKSVEGAVLFAEVVSCLKRTLARMLVIIVSLGFGIVKPRLGPLLHRVVGVGTLYFILSVVAASMQIFHMRNDPNRQLMLAEIALAVLDSIICWWIFSSLVQTTRTLRLRRNIVKLTLYRHFTNTLIFAVIASVAYTVWYVRSHRWPECLTDWKELWVDEAYWRLLFSIILLVIMILWRPTNNNQRYAFTPLLDAPDDDEDEQVMSDAFEGMKMRGFMKNQNHVSPKENDTKGVDEDLKWVEEHIPSTIADAALPTLLDSDEEIMTTKFEISKMN